MKLGDAENLLSSLSGEFRSPKIFGRDKGTSGSGVMDETAACGARGPEFISLFIQGILLSGLRW